MVWSGYGRLTNSGELKIQVSFWDDSERLVLKQGTKESGRLYTCVLSGSSFADSQPEPQGCMRPEMPPQKQAFLPSNIWKCWKLLSQTFPQPLMRLATLQTVLYGRQTVCLRLWGHTLEEGSSSLLRRRQLTSLFSVDPSLWLQSSHFTSESKAGLTMEHSPSLFIPCQSERWLGGSSNYVEHAGTIFMSKKIGATTVLKADEVMPWAGHGCFSSSNKAQGLPSVWILKNIFRYYFTWILVNLVL